MPAMISGTVSSSAWVNFSTVMRSKRSATAPPIIGKVIMGMPKQRLMRPRASGELVSCKISQASAIICIWAPTLEKISPNQRMRKFREWSAAKRGLRLVIWSAASASAAGRAVSVVMAVKFRDRYVEGRAVWSPVACARRRRWSEW